MDNLEKFKEQTIDLDEFKAKYDKESDYRRHHGFWKTVVAIIAISFFPIQVYTGILRVYRRTYSTRSSPSFACFLVFYSTPPKSFGPVMKCPGGCVISFFLAASHPAIYIVVFYQISIPFRYRYRSGSNCLEYWEFLLVYWRPPAVVW